LLNPGFARNKVAQSVKGAAGAELGENLHRRRLPNYLTGSDLGKIDSRGRETRVTTVAQDLYINSTHEGPRNEIK